MESRFSSRFRIVDTLRRHKQVSRVEIAEITGMSRSAITGLTQELLEQGLIKETSDDSPISARGRPRVQIELNPAAGYVVGVKLSLHQLSCAITDFRGEILHTITLPFNGGQEPEEAADTVEKAVNLCLEEAAVPLERVLGLCVGIPGYISQEGGICYWSPVFNQRDVNFKKILGERFNWECYIENDANLVALSEHWFGHAKDISTFAVVTVEHGIGMGLIVDGELYRGANGIGPEFGHSKVVHNGRACRCGQNGCVEAYASDYAILREIDADFSLEAYNTNPQSFHPMIEDATRRALEGDEELQKIFAEAGRWLGRAMGNLISIMNPPTIFLTGEAMRAGSLLTDTAREEARANQLSYNLFDTRIIITNTNDDVWAQGAAALVLEHIYTGASKVKNVYSTAGMEVSTNLTI